MPTFVVKATNLKTLHECRGLMQMTTIYAIGENERYENK